MKFIPDFTDKQTNLRIRKIKIAENIELTRKIDFHLSNRDPSDITFFLQNLRQLF